MERQDHGESVPFADAQVAAPQLRERMVGLRGRLLRVAGILVASFAITGYLGVTVLLVLLLLGMRSILPRRAMDSILRPDGNAPLYSGVGNLPDTATAIA